MDGDVSAWRHLCRGDEQGDGASGDGDAASSNALALLELRDGLGRGPLHYAALSGHAPLVRAALGAARQRIDASLAAELDGLRRRLRSLSQQGFRSRRA